MAGKRSFKFPVINKDKEKAHKLLTSPCYAISI